MNTKRKISKDKCHVEGRYANYFRVGQNAFEFVLEFVQFYPGNGEAHTHTRIITSPIYAKALLEMLQNSIDKYEKVFGRIQKNEEINSDGL